MLHFIYGSSLKKTELHRGKQEAFTDKRGFLNDFIVETVGKNEGEQKQQPTVRNFSSHI